MAKWTYTFGGGCAEGDMSKIALLGGKGANLAELASLGLPVPPGFTISTDACNYFLSNGKKLPDELTGEIQSALGHLEKLTNRRFGDRNSFLLVSVRPGAQVSMPGMTETILNLGLNDETVEALAAQSGDPRFAYDSYRRFIQMYSGVVLGIDHDEFEELLDELKRKKGFEQDTALTADDWKEVVKSYKSLVEEELGEPFPQNPFEQLTAAIEAVFGSWQNPRADIFRQLNSIPFDWGTAVNIQAMVFGNRGDNSGTGIALTRNPDTGANELNGKFLVNAQGEEVTAGLREPFTLTAARNGKANSAASFEKLMPEAFAEFTKAARKLEHHHKEMKSIEFTIEQDKLWILEARTGRRTTSAALRIAVDMVEEGLITKEEAVAGIDPTSLDQLLHPTIAEGMERDIISSGLPASPGAATGRIVFDPDEAEKIKSGGDNVILVRVETSPEDIHGMHAAEGILTLRGGMASHAALFARGKGKPCVCGAGSLRINLEEEEIFAGERKFAKGDIITIDGSTGQVLAGQVEMVEPKLSGAFGIIMNWADEIRRMEVRCNADTPDDAQIALSFGAEGIGLCRTEHMFFDDDRITVVRETILAEDENARRQALQTLLPMQRQDFVELFAIMKGYPVTIRLLDPPLHEFLPNTDDEMITVAKSMNMDFDILKRRITNLHEFNPMLGHRGCRLAISYPEIAEMQAQAIFEAIAITHENEGKAPIVEIMVPLVGFKRELDFVKDRIRKVAKRVEEETGQRFKYLVGTMIELPRAALRGSEIAQSAEFFSFGTNDLTQTTLGISRDDASQFMANYEAKQIIDSDPFATLDTEGVGELIKIASQRSRETKPEIKLGICGEHGGEPVSIRFFEKIGMDYVSCSPYRVPVARLATAQATLHEKAFNDSIRP